MSDQRTNPVRRLRRAADASSPPKRRPSGPCATGEGRWRVSDDLPRPTPIGRAEIEVLEVYLGTQIDDILRRMRS